MFGCCNVAIELLNWHTTTQLQTFSSVLCSCGCMNSFWPMGCKQNEVCNTDISLYGKICPYHSFSLSCWLVHGHGNRNGSSHVFQDGIQMLRMAGHLHKRSLESSMTSRGELPYKLSYLAHLTRKIHPLSCIHDPVYIILLCVSAGSIANGSDNNINQV